MASQLLGGSTGTLITTRRRIGSWRWVVEVMWRKTRARADGRADWAFIRAVLAKGERLSCRKPCGQSASSLRTLLRSLLMATFSPRELQRPRLAPCHTPEERKSDGLHGQYNREMSATW